MQTKFWIYKIESPSGKIYIGQTTNYPKRLRQYKQMAKTGVSNQRLLVKSLFEFGFNNHKFTILFEGESSRKTIDDLERNYIKKYKSFGTKIGLNLHPGGRLSGITDDKYTSIMKESLSRPEIKEKLSKKAKERELRIKDTKCKVIQQWSIDGKLINEFLGYTRAAEAMGAHFQSIQRVCLGGRKTFRGFVWKAIQQG